MVWKIPETKNSNPPKSLKAQHAQLRIITSAKQEEKDFQSKNSGGTNSLNNQLQPPIPPKFFSMTISSLRSKGNLPHFFPVLLIKEMVVSIAAKLYVIVAQIQKIRKRNSRYRKGKQRRLLSIQQGILGRLKVVPQVEVILLKPIFNHTTFLRINL